MQQIHFKRKSSHVTCQHYSFDIAATVFEVRLRLFTFTYKIGCIVMLYLHISLSSNIILTEVLIQGYNFCMDYTN